jgi:hypothetical protein
VSPDLGCARYFGRDITRNVVVSISIEWTGSTKFTVKIDTDFLWEVRLAESSFTHFMNAAAHLMPDAWWQRKSVLKAMGTAAGLALGAGKMNLTGKAPNGHEFIANPQRMWLIDASHAILHGTDLGPQGALPRQANLNDFFIPQRGLFVVARAYLRTPWREPNHGAALSGLTLDNTKEVR